MSRADLFDTVRLMLAKPSLWNPRSPRAADGSQALTAWFDSSASGGVQTDGAVSFTAACKHRLTCESNATTQTGDIDFEVGLWAYVATTPSAYRFYASKATIGAREWSLMTNWPSRELTFAVYNGVDAAVGTVTAGELPNTTWTFIRAWHNSSDNTVNIQLNNGTVYSAGTTGTVAATSTALQIGGSSMTPVGYVNGAIDSLYFTKRISTADEATALYNAGAGRVYADLTSANGLDTFATNLVSWWDFDEENQTRYDSKGTNHLLETFDELVTNGTFTGASTGWTEGTGWAYGTNNEAATAATGNLTQSLAAVAAKKYDIKFTIAVTGGSVRYTFGGVTGTTRDATGTFYERATATSTASLVIDPVADFTGTLDDVSIKSAEIPRAAGVAKSDATTATSLGAELLTNGGFETAGAGGADVWGTWSETAGSGTIADETSSVKSGLHAAKLSYGTGSSIIGVSATVTASTAYRLTFWTRGDGSNAGRYVVTDSTHGGAAIVALVTTGVSTTTWTQKVVNFTTPAGCVAIGIALYSPTSGDAYYDDVSLRQVFAGRVSCLCDQSGAGNHLTQTTDTYRPVVKLAAQNSRAGLDFDGSDDNLSNAADLLGTGDATVFAVFTADGWGGGNAGRLVDNGRYELFVSSTNGRLVLTSDGTTNAVAATNSVTLSTPAVWVITRTSTGVVNFYENGVLSGSANQASGTPVAATSATLIGNYATLIRAFDGHILAMGVYKGTILSAAQITQLSRFLGSRWGVTVV